MQTSNSHAGYGSWLCKLDFDSDDDSDEAATTSRSSQSQEVEPFDKDGAINSVMLVAGIKRRGDLFSVHSSPSKKPRLEKVGTDL